MGYLICIDNESDDESRMLMRAFVCCSYSFGFLSLHFTTYGNTSIQINKQELILLLLFYFILIFLGINNYSMICIE